MSDNQISVQNFIDRVAFHESYADAYNHEKMTAFDAAHAFSWMDDFLWEANKRDGFSIQTADGEIHTFDKKADWQFRSPDSEALALFLKEHIDEVVEIVGESLGGRVMRAILCAGEWETTIERKYATMSLRHLAELPWIDAWDDEGRAASRAMGMAYEQVKFVKVIQDLISLARAVQEKKMGISADFFAEILGERFLIWADFSCGNPCHIGISLADCRGWGITYDDPQYLHSGILVNPSPEKCDRWTHWTRTVPDAIPQEFVSENQYISDFDEEPLKAAFNELAESLERYNEYRKMAHLVKGWAKMAEVPHGESSDRVRRSRGERGPRPQGERGPRRAGPVSQA